MRYYLICITKHGSRPVQHRNSRFHLAPPEIDPTALFFHEVVAAIREINAVYGSSVVVDFNIHPAAGIKRAPVTDGPTTWGGWTVEDILRNEG
jgi:hypothetical protein